MATTSDPAGSGDRIPPGQSFSPAYRGYILAILCFTYALNVLDRSILTILQEVVKHDLALSDTQLALLSGLAFSVLYSVASLVIARWADTSVRRSVLSLAIVFWSVSTAACGLVSNFVQLLLARASVGAGEAGSIPTSHSIIADMYPVERRGMAMGILGCGVFIGQFLGMALGGWLGSAYGWRTTFLILGGAGILFGLLVRLTVAEPPRLHPHVAQPVSLWTVAGLLGSSPVARHLLAGTAWFCAISAINHFIPSYLMRSHGLSMGQAGIWLGIVGGIGGIFGVLVGGRVTDRLSRRRFALLPWIPGGAMLATAPFLLLGLSSSSSVLMLMAYLLPSMIVAIHFAPCILIMHSLVPDHARARSSAVYMLVSNLFGVSLNTLLIGVLSDAMNPRFGQDALGYALMIVMVLGCVGATFHFHRTSRYLRAAEAA